MSGAHPGTRPATPVRSTVKMSGAHPRHASRYPGSFWGVRPLHRVFEESGLWRVQQLDDPRSEPKPAPLAIPPD